MDWDKQETLPLSAAVRTYWRKYGIHVGALFRGGAPKQSLSSSDY